MPKLAVPHLHKIVLDEPERQKRLARIRQMVQVLDNAFVVPGTNWRFGWDAIIGLVPGGGDVATGLLATYIVIEAARLGVSKATIVRMLGNVAIDVTAGAVPLAGDLLDAAFKANKKNLKLLEAHLERQAKILEQSE